MDNQVVIMAGGRGTRLHPLTEHSPKPMLKVGSKPILETVICGFRDQGFEDFTLCVNYRGELIERYFEDGSHWGVRIKYTHEKEPLGTAGALKLIERPKKPFIVSNADVLTHVNFRELIAFHQYSEALATVCLALYQHQIPYGVAESEGAKVTDILEKPIKNFAVNAGIYALSPQALDCLPDGPSDMPDLLKTLIRKGNGTQAVTAYCLTEYWIDVGTFNDLDRARVMAQ